MAYKVTPKTQEIAENTTLTADGNFGDWMAVNTGTANATVDGYELAPGEGLGWKGLQPNVVWNAPIKITLLPGAKVRITRLQYKKTRIKSLD